MNTLFLFVVICQSMCIVLNLPFEEDSSLIKWKRTGENSPLILEQNGVRYGKTFYEGVDKNLITKVRYLGNELFNDTEERPETFRRLVNYGEMGKGILISIYSGTDEMELDKIFYISKVIVYDLMKARRILNLKRHGSDSNGENNSLKSVCYELKLQNQYETETGGDESWEPGAPSIDEGTLTEDQIKKELETIFGSILIKAVAKSILKNNECPN